MPRTLLEHTATRVARVVGSGIGAAFAIVGRVRPAVKPLHPRGRMLTGTLTVTGLRPAAAPLDVPWLRDARVEQVLVRLSRSAGLPPPFPDVFGMAMRVPGPENVADLLLSTTGTGRWSRFVLVPRRSLFASYTTLMPYRTRSGPITVRADIRAAAARVTPVGADVPLPLEIRLSVAGRSRRWESFGTVLLTSPALPDEADPPVSFDAVLNEPPGLETYRWAALLREPSYAAARRSRAPGMPLARVPAAVPRAASTNQQLQQPTP